MKRALALMLALLMLVMTVAACGAKDTQTDDTTTTAPSAGNDTTTPSDTSATEPAETVPPELVDSIPETRFDGEVFTALIREETKHELHSEEITGDLVGDAVYNRNLAVEERLGVEIEVITTQGNWDHRDNFINRVSNSILGGSHEFDMAMTHNAYLATLILRGLAYDLNEMEVMDFSKKWWCRNYVENIEIDGKIFSVMGDIGVSLYEYLEAVFFNKTVAEQNHIDDLYQVVLDGNWTFDKMMGYVKQVGSDLNGDGIYNENDLFGLSIDGHNVRYACTIWETGITTVGADGLRDFNLPNEKFIDAYEILYNAIYETDQTFYDTANKHMVKMFTNDQLLFMTERLSQAAKMKEMTSEYGIIPFPKYNDEQKEYISATRDSHSGLIVASDVLNPDMVDSTIEAMCMYGYEMITPAYYETTLKLKYLSDETAMSMLDLIRDSVDFDFAILYTVPLSTMYSFYGEKIASATPSIASAVKAQAKAWQKLLDKMYEDFNKLEK